MDEVLKMIQRLFGWDNPYREGHVGYYRYFHFDKIFTARTPALFKVEFRLRGHVERVDNDTFNKAEMLAPEHRERLVEQWYGEVALPLLEHSSFPSWHWNRPVEWIQSNRLMTSMSTALFQATSDGSGGLKIEADSDFSKTQQAIQAASAQWMTNGCKVSLSAMEFAKLNKELVEENCAMISKAEMEMIRSDPRFGRNEEATVVATVKRTVDLLSELTVAHTDGQYECDYIFVRTKNVNAQAQIAWETKKSVRGLRLQLFRKVHSFNPEIWTETDNGLLVADTASSGTLTETLQLATTQCYTLLVTGLDERGTRVRLDHLRFTLSFPSEGDIARLQKWAGYFLEKTGSRQVKFTKVMEELDGYIELDEAMTNAEKRLREKIEGLEYSHDEKQDRKERLASMFEAMRREHLP